MRGFELHILIFVVILAVVSASDILYSLGPIKSEDDYINDWTLVEQPEGTVAYRGDKNAAMLRNPDGGSSYFYTNVSVDSSLEYFQVRSYFKDF